MFILVFPRSKSPQAPSVIFYLEEKNTQLSAYTFSLRHLAPKKEETGKYF